MLTHFAIVLRPLRTPPERPSAFRRLCLPSSSPKSPDGYCYAIFALTVKLWLAVPYARRKNASAFSALLVVTEFPPFPFPLLLCNKESTESPVGRGHSRSRSAGTFPNCVTRFRGGALRHAKFPKTSYKVQLLDTLKHAACVSLNRGRRRGLIFLSKKVLVPFKQNACVLSGEGHPRTPTCVLPQKFFRSIYCFIFLSML